MNFHNEKQSSQKKEEKNYTKNKRILQQSARRKKWEETIHVHAEVVKNTKNVVDNNSNCIE
jgi:hypothetical protein